MTMSLVILFDRHHSFLYDPRNVLKTIVTDIDPKAFVAIAQGHQTKGGMLPKKREKL